MKLIFTLLFICVAGAVSSQTYVSSCTPTIQMERLYYSDAYYSANARLIATNNPYKDSIEIPAIFRDSVARVFYLIHNMAPSPVKDTIMNLFGFSNFNAGDNFEGDSLHFLNNLVPNLKIIYLRMPTSTQWAAEWAAGNFNNTSNAEVNQLVNKYGLAPQLNFTFNGNYNFTVRAGLILNTNGLAKKFVQILSGNGLAEAMGYIGDGNSATLTFDNDGIQIKYRNGCGDCPAGCTFGKNWTFKVYYANCNVDYLSTTNQGFALPPGSQVYSCTRGDVVVPVIFGPVTGYIQNGLAVINWIILTQQNVKEYVIEKSGDGTHFLPAGSIPANASNNVPAYNWKDLTPISGAGYYRIKAIDFDGKSKHSQILLITACTKGNLFSVYPNPVVGNYFSIRFNNPQSGKVKVALYNMLGENVWSTTSNLPPQTNSQSLFLPPSVASGVYTIMVQSGEGRYQNLIVVEKL